MILPCSAIVGVALPDLRVALCAHREIQQTLTGPPRGAALRGTDVPEIKALLDWVIYGWRQVEALSRQPERALEVAVRQAGRVAVHVHAAISLLPDPIQTRDACRRARPGVAIPPKHAVSAVIGFIKGKSAIHLARVCWEHRRNFGGGGRLGEG